LVPPGNPQNQASITIHSTPHSYYYYYYYYGNRTQGTVVKTHTQKYNQIERKNKRKENKGKLNQINWYTKSEWYNQPRP